MPAVRRHTGRHAEEAIRLHVSVFPHSTIDQRERHAPGGPETEGTLQVGRFAFGGQEFLAIDRAVDHRFTFPPAVSIYTRCESEAEFDSVFGERPQGGDGKMPPGHSGFRRTFAGFDDRFGVSWPLNHPDESPGPSPAGAAPTESRFNGRVSLRSAHGVDRPSALRPNRSGGAR